LLGTSSKKYPRKKIPALLKWPTQHCDSEKEGITPGWSANLPQPDVGRLARQNEAAGVGSTYRCEGRFLSRDWIARASFRFPEIAEAWAVMAETNGSLPDRANVKFGDLRECLSGFIDMLVREFLWIFTAS
jgi:hypothetical protein